MTTPRKRPMRRIGDLIPDAARALGLEEELRLARAIATFEAVVAERVPAAAGSCRVIRLEGFAVAEFTLDQVNDAVAHSAVNSGPFKMTVVKP